MGSAASAPGAPSERLSIDEARALLPDGRAWRDSWDLRFTSVGIAEPKTVGRATALRVWAKDFFWAAKDLETYETAVTHRDYVESLDWTADGRLFVSAGDSRRPAAATNSERFRPGKR